MKHVGPWSLVVLGCIAPWAAAQTPPDYGLDWRTIGDPGNPGASPLVYPLLERPVGEVDYTFRLTRTEIRNTQWIQFGDAYAHANPAADINDPSFTGRFVYHSSNNPANFGWFTPPGAENAPAQIGWFYAARYCNWLQSGKSPTAPLSAFETGVYDMSTFHRVNNFEWTGQTTRAPGSQFWIPSWDEWNKGMHWDPNKLGPGAGGYWRFPNSGNTIPVSGLPGTPGAQTSARLNPAFIQYLPVASYPDQQSPWGLLDGSGGVSEYLDTWSDGVPLMRGDRIGGSTTGIDDRLDVVSGVWPIEFAGGLRLASSVPSPGVSVALCLGFFAFARRARVG